MSCPARRVHNRTATKRQRGHNPFQSRDPTVCVKPMLLIVGVLITATAAVALSKFRVPGGVNGARIGWMSEQWLAEQRASRPL